MENTESRQHKVLVVGARQVGKTSLIQRYLFNEFSISVPQMNSEEKKTVSVKNGQVNLVICDMAGN